MRSQCARPCTLRHGRRCNSGSPQLLVVAPGGEAAQLPTHTPPRARCPPLQDYLNAFTGFTLTVCGLGMGSKRLHEGSGSGIILAGDTHGTGACAGGCDDHHLLYHTCGTASTRTASTTTNNHNHSTFSTNTTVNHGATMVDSASSGGACPSVGRAH